MINGYDLPVQPDPYSKPNQAPPLDPASRSAEWWRDHLLGKLVARRKQYDEYWSFYEGNQPLAIASQRFKEVFGWRYGKVPANFMPLVVDAERERLIVQGFRFGNASDTDKTAWEVWQDNQLDAESMIAHEISLAKGAAYVMVSPLNGVPEITIEDPCEVIVETTPGNRRKRLAGLKLWRDDEGYDRAYVYLPDNLWKWRSSSPAPSDAYTEPVEVNYWTEFSEPDEARPVPNSLLVVPIVPLLNRPRRDGMGRSELTPVVGNQNAINKLRFDALVASEFVAFPQRWATNIEVPIDEKTGKPSQPFKPGVDSLWVVTRPSPERAMEYGDRVPAPAFGQFPAADMAPYTRLIEEEIGIMASNSRTPYHYLLGEPTAVPPSGESLKSSEAPLVKKVNAAAVHFGEAWEEVMRLALRVKGQNRKADRSNAGETIWKDPETRNEAARTDAILKQFQAGLLSEDFAMAELGYSQQQIDQNKAQKEAEPPPEPVAPPPSGAGGFPPAPAEGILPS